MQCGKPWLVSKLGGLLMYRLFSTLVFLLTFFVGLQNANAKVYGLDPVIGHGLDAVLWASGQSNLKFTRFYKRVGDPVMVARADKALLKIKNSRIKMCYPKIKVAIIDGDGIANAFSSGPTLYLTKRVFSLATDDELLAILLHEMAHSDDGHLVLRMLHSPAAVMYQFYSLVTSDLTWLSTGETDAFMDELHRKGHWKMMREMIEGASFGEELFADHVAFNNLCLMKKRGFDVDPRAVASALSVVTEVPVYVLKVDSSEVGQRWRQLMALSCN